jgi:NADH dehydrogenase FAD-containing subunit
VEADRAGRVPVEPDCTLAGHPEVFAIGDMVSLNKLLGVAPARGRARRAMRRNGWLREGTASSLWAAGSAD